MKKSIVISAVNLVEGGAFSILQDCLSEISKSDLVNDYQIIAFVNSISKMPQLAGVKYYEFPKAKKHYVYRLFYEYYYFKKISQIIKPKIWLSLHDMSPCVNAEIQAVYMHNTIPFYKPGIKDWKFVPLNAVWAYLYKYVYKINIKSNKYLVVQQGWLRDTVSIMFSFPKNRIIVSRPQGKLLNISESKSVMPKIEKVFVYPAYPRVFKNFDVICEAAQILEKWNVKNLRIILTIDGTENKYSKYLKNKYSDINILEFKGVIPYNQMTQLYLEADCLLFPSKLESWGLPLSEFKPLNKPMIVSDLPYAHESASGACAVKFINPDNAEELALCIKEVVNNNYSSFIPVPEVEIQYPLSDSWTGLFNILLGVK